ncbi:MAG: HEAT repeat domain-containing protein [Labilithrix sp.]|nr:HEAT repeat domain-containing protein [Labilithrix sp.]MBX3223032.1 HEAT repeat domain-containing protein [Labilithrix sp.]
MRARALTAAVTTSLALALTSAAAQAAGPRVSAPAGGGLDAVEAAIDEAAGVLEVRRCRAATCAEAGGTKRSIPIPIERSRLDLTRPTLEVIPIGEGRRVIHVRIADARRPDLAFEAIVAGNDSEPIFAGLTGYTRGEEGDRSGEVLLFYDRPGASEREGAAKFVIVAEAREDTRICGQATTPLGARGLDPKTLELRGATLHRLEKAARDGATRIVAGARAASARPPLARLLLATGGSAPGAQALTDGKPETTWSEKRPGDGHGEFATMRAPSEVPIHAVVVTPAPKGDGAAPAPKGDGAAPRTFFLATDQRLFHVTMPEDAWSKPGASYEIPLPAPVRTTCVAVVLDEAYGRDLKAPEVSLAEVSAVTKFDVDGASMDDVAAELGGPRAEEAAALLRRGGDDGLAAVAKRLRTLDASGRALAVDVAASAGSCDGTAMDLLTRALADKESEVRKRALGRIERCGKAATESLASAVRSGDEPRRAAAAPLLATIAPAAALDPIGEQLGKGSAATRRALRGAFARAAASSPREPLLAHVANKELSATARLDLLRATGARLATLRPESSAAIADVLRGAPDMPTRYLVAQPLAQLARSSDATSGELTRLAEMIRRDPDWPVRMRAVELSAGIAPLVPTIVAAVADPEPRVREAALRALAIGKAPSGAGAAASALASDGWTFVRVAAAEALGAIPESAAGQGALASALADGSPKVRGAALTALGSLHATRQAEKIRERLDDGKEDVEVRALAARTLGALCVTSAADRLTKLAHLSRSPVDEADERLGMAAIEALSALHPPDLDRRLAPLRAKEVRMPVRRAAERALAEPGVCR